jgi:hypothetical protein
VKAGTYPTFLKLHYADANSYPFSTMSPALFRFIQSAPILSRAQMTDIKMTEKGSGILEVQASNLDSIDHDMTFKLWLPDEIASESPFRKLRVSGKGMERFEIPISSFGALEGSTYVVYASNEIKKDGLHHGSISNSKVEIVSQAETGEGEGLQLLPAVALGILILAFIIIQFRR